jgi:putative DNA primase/helicase
MPRLASSDPALAVVPADFDADAWLLNTPNGVVDLTDGRLLTHSPAYLMTRTAATVYDPAARSPLWEAFVASIFGCDAELIRWVRRFLGYSLTADTALQLFPVFWGSGRNGKSTLIDTLRAVVGPYWGKAAPEMLLAKSHSTHPTEVADLKGLRLAFSVETDEGRKLNEARVKEITGDATLKARRMRENFWEFSRTNKTVLITNHRPKVETGGDGMWRRIRLVPFVQRFWNEDAGESGPAHLKADLKLPEKLLAERTGILTWLVQGAVECYRDELRLGSCRAISAATAEYQAGEDVFAQFVADKLVLTTGGADELPAGDVFDTYRAWCADSNQKPATKRKLTEMLIAAGAAKRESNGKTIYVGVSWR